MAVLAKVCRADVGGDAVATALVRGGTDLVVVADLLGHARLNTVRAYTGCGRG